MSGLALKGKVAIITGGGRGIGAATAEALVREGARVVISSRTEHELLETQNKISSENIFSVVADVSDEGSVKKLFDQAISKFKKIDLLINNAGIFSAGVCESLALSDWNQTLAVNLTGSFLCAREALRRMASGGVIVNISSLAGIRGTQKYKGFGAYAASKFGVIGLTEVLAVEAQEKGIRVNCVAPGAIETQMLKKALPLLHAKSKPEDLAGVILGLCDDTRSKILNGAVIEVFTEVS